MASEGYSEFVLQQFGDWQAEQVAAATQPAASQPAGARGGRVNFVGPGGQVVVTSTADFAAWWGAQDKAGLLAGAGGWRAALNWWVAVMAFWMAITCVALGTMWAVAFLARGRVALLGWAVIVTLTAACFAAIPMIDWLTGQPMWYSSAARSQMGPVSMAAGLTWGGLWLAAGLMIGRPVARGLVRLMLPPRLRSSLAVLWLTDGLEPPGTGKRSTPQSAQPSK
jgi:hypothetical protein